jgi:sec-independent protein translocase protein TatC
LTSKEKRYVFTAVPFVAGLFLGGLTFAYYVAIPPAINFLTTFGADIARPEIRISNYINIVTRLLIAVGISFETPLIIMVLARIGVVTPEWLAKQRRIWVIVAFILGALITPTFDPINQTIIALPLIVLYEISIWLARLVRKRKANVPA